MMKKINKNLTAEQKLVLFEDGTESPGTSELNHEKREGSFHCANCEEKLFDSSAKYESGSGWPSFYQSLPDAFETKRILYWGTKELSIIVKNVVDIMVIFLKMDQTQLEKDTVIMVFA